ncbi:LuxR family transcriptional regulator [Methylocella tundrae]|uniref:LuxR family transcriptional regulator n=2 Tax=Methylocella tundrae TaxID=227605 RepID=A0A8B6M636_METTU|nr:LuxR family transcriptional regulator [Methylocella tundrae]
MRFGFCPGKLYLILWIGRMSQSAEYAMSSHVEKSPLLRFDDEEWFRRLGGVARSIGTDGFHRELIDLFGASIRHESSWIIRYSRVAPPDVIYTHNVSDEIVDVYNEQCSGVDPFSQYWKSNGSPGVLTLSELKNSSAESIIYSRIFQAAANVSDEMGMFFSTVGHCCFGLFLEREKGHFSKADVQRAQLIFPALEGYHRAHLGWLFNDLRHTNDTEIKGFIKRPTLIQDRFGVEVYSNESWNQAVASDASIMSTVATLFAGSSPQTRLLKDFVLKSEVFDRDFPLAPGGRMFVLEPQSSPRDEPDYISRIASILHIFTPREREILTLIMRGQNTGQIAQKLEISKGTIKNCRLRIYRKADVVSERALVKKFTPVFHSL